MYFDGQYRFYSWKSKTENPRDFNDETANDSIVPIERDDLRR